MKIVKKILRIVLVLIAVLLASLISFIIFAVISDYKPVAKELISQSETPSVIKDTLALSLLSWNIGYAGLDKNMDFFYDGGTKVITPERNCLENISAIGDFLKRNDTIDFILIQEIDRKSKRSYRIDEYKGLLEGLPGYNPCFAKNYDVFFVPLPPAKPMGKVLSGMAVFSKFVPESSERYSLSGNFGFPTQLFQLDRCFIVNRYKVENGKELVMINTHNEAFDKGGKIRKTQMEQIHEFILNEYNSGNYVIAGGDWNQYPPDFKPEFKRNRGFTGRVGNFDLVGIEADYLSEEWKWIYDAATPSFRTVMEAYDPESTPASVCDFFLVSPNIEPVSIRCQNLDFANSDHNPVIIQVKLR